MRKRNMINCLKIASACLCMIGTMNFAIPQYAYAADDNITYIKDVEAKMCSADYWSKKAVKSDKVLLGEENIKKLNSEIMNESKTCMYDLANYRQVVDGVSMSNALMNGTAKDFTNVPKYYFVDGSKITREYCDELIANCANPDAVTEQEVRYGICTTRADLRAYPTLDVLSDSPTDPDYDAIQLSAIHVNEPVAIESVSEDKEFYYVKTSSCCGWVSAKAIAICANKEEWLNWWQIDSKDALVVTADNISLEYSNYEPRLSRKYLTMGTILRLVAKADIPEMVNNRKPYSNYVVYMPLRKADGTCEKGMAMISQNEEVSVGYLPLTTKNILDTAFNMIGNCYGWGGMLGSNDCSGFVKDVYRCFGVEIARNTTWQSLMPVKKYDLSTMTVEEKKTTIASLPAGSLLYFKGHAMMYLGMDNDKYYVISSLSNIADDTGKVSRVRGIIVNTLDAKRANGMTWLEALSTAVIPYYSLNNIETYIINCASKVYYTGKALTPSVSVMNGDKKLVKDVDYKLTYANNYKIGTASVTITGCGNYVGSKTLTYKIEARKGSIQTIGNYRYKITCTASSKNQTVSIVGLVKKRATEKINNTVVIGGRTYKVTAIDANAFANNKTITSLTLSSNVTSIGEKAFYNCTKLKSLTICSTELKSSSIGKNAFAKMGSSSYSKVKINVVNAKVKAYKSLFVNKGLNKKCKVY